MLLIVLIAYYVCKLVYQILKSFHRENTSDFLIGRWATGSENAINPVSWLMSFIEFFNRTMNENARIMNQVAIIWWLILWTTHHLLWQIIKAQSLLKIHSRSILVLKINLKFNLTYVWTWKVQLNVRLYKFRLKIFN